MQASLILKIISFGVCLIILIGLAYRHNRRVHPKLMMSAFVIDVAMVLYIELTRHAVNTALHPPHPFVMIHVAISVTVMILYLVQIGLGIRLMKGRGTSRVHGRIGWLFVGLRLANFITSLWVERFVHQGA